MGEGGATMTRQEKGRKEGGEVVRVVRPPRGRKRKGSIKYLNKFDGTDTLRRPFDVLFTEGSDLSH